MRTILAAMAMATAITAAGPAAAQKTDSRGEAAEAKLTELQAEIVAIIEQAEAQQYDPALTRLSAVIDGPDFKDVPSEAQTMLIRLKAGMEHELGRYAEALTTYRRVTALPDSTPEDWFWRVSAASNAGEHADAAAGVVRLAGEDAEQLQMFNNDFLRRLALTDLESVEDGATHQGRLIDALFDAGWNDKASALWTLRARQLVEAGDNRRAADLVARVDQPGSLIAMTVDRRFDALRPRAGFDVAAALSAELGRVRAAAQGEDSTLETRNAYASALMERGRFDEALAAIDAALAPPAEGKGETETPDNDHLIWALDTRARTLVFLGRTDEALADLRRAARRPESGGLNVSHAINLGALYLRLDRPADALDAVADIADDDVSPFGFMQLTGVRGCAHVMLGNATEAKAALDSMEAHSADDPNTLGGHAICAGDPAAAARHLIARLDDPALRSDALVAAQDYLDPPHPTAADVRWTALSDQVLARPDVRAALDRAGRIESWPLIGPQF